MAVSRKNRKNMNMNKNKNRNNRDKKTRNKRLKNNTRNKRNRNKEKVSRKKRMRGGSKGYINPNLTKRMVGVASTVYGAPGAPDPSKEALLKKLENERQSIKKFYNEDLGVYGRQLSAINVAKKYSKIFGNEALTLEDWIDFSNKFTNKPLFENSGGKKLAVHGSNLVHALERLKQRIKPKSTQVIKLRKNPGVLPQRHPSTSPRKHGQSPSPLRRTNTANTRPSNVLPGITKKQLNEMRGSRGNLGTLGLGGIVEADYPHGPTNVTKTDQFYYEA